MSQPSKPSTPKPLLSIRDTGSATLHDITSPDHKEPTYTPNEYPPSEDISSSGPDLDNSEPCKSFTLDDSTLEHLIDHYSNTYSINIPSIFMSLSILHNSMSLTLIGEPMEDLQVLTFMFWRELVGLSQSLI